MLRGRSASLAEPEGQPRGVRLLQLSRPKSEINSKGRYIETGLREGPQQCTDVKFVRQRDESKYLKQEKKKVFHTSYLGWKHSKAIEKNLFMTVLVRIDI